MQEKIKQIIKEHGNKGCEAALLAEICGANKRTIQHHLANLTNEGTLEKIRKGNKTLYFTTGKRPLTPDEKAQEKHKRELRDLREKIMNYYSRINLPDSHGSNTTDLPFLNCHHNSAFSIADITWGLGLATQYENEIKQQLNNLTKENVLIQTTPDYYWYPPPHLMKEIKEQGGWWNWYNNQLAQHPTGMSQWILGGGITLHEALSLCQMRQAN